VNRADVLRQLGKTINDRRDAYDRQDEAGTQWLGISEQTGNMRGEDR